MIRLLPVVALFLVLGLAWGMATSPAFRVGEGCGFCPPPEVGADAGWDRTCLGWRHRVVVMDAEWEQCLGVPVGPRRCYALAAGDTTGAFVAERVPCARP